MRMSVYAAFMTIMLSAGAAQAQAHVDISQAPPSEPVYEVKPGDRPGYYYAPGYWRWNGKSHVWQSSRWVVDRPGYTWVPDGWEQHGTKWHFAKGYWADANGDEVDEATLANAGKTTDSDAADTPAPAKSKAKKKAARKPDFSNKRLWPRVVHH